MFPFQINNFSFDIKCVLSGYVYALTVPTYLILVANLLVCVTIINMLFYD